MFLFLLPLPETQPDGDGLDAPRPAESYTTIVRKLHQKFTIRVRVKYTTFYSLLQNSYNEQQINYLETNKQTNIDYSVLCIKFTPEMYSFGISLL